MDRALDLLFLTIGAMAIGSVVIMKLASDAFDRKHNPRD